MNGKMIKQMVRENLPILMAMFMMDNGKTIRQTGMGFIYIKTEQSMKDNGLTIFNMERELKYVNMNVKINS